MMELFEQLDRLVEKKTVHYGQLIDLLNEEWRHIGDSDLEKLEALLVRKEALLITIHEINLQREQVVRAIGEQFEIDPVSLTLKEIIRPATRTGRGCSIFAACCVRKSIQSTA